MLSSELCQKLHIPYRRLASLVERGFIDYPKAAVPRYGQPYDWSKEQVRQIVLALMLDKKLSAAAIRKLTRNPSLYEVEDGWSLAINENYLDDYVASLFP